MQEIKEHYLEQIEELSYEKYTRLVFLLQKTHAEFGSYTEAEYYTMIDNENSKFVISLWKNGLNPFNLSQKLITCHYYCLIPTKIHKNMLIQFNHTVFFWYVSNNHPIFCLSSHPLFDPSQDLIFFSLLSPLLTLVVLTFSSTDLYLNVPAA